MKRPSLFAMLGLFACASVAVCAQGVDPKEALKEINTYRQTKFAEARQAKKPYDAAALNAEIVEKAKACVKGVEVDKVEAKDAYDWAQLFSMAQMNKETCDLAKKFLTSNPDADRKFSAQMMMLNACNAMGEGEMLSMTLKEVIPPNSFTGRTLGFATVNNFADTIKRTQGVNAALSALDTVEKALPVEDPKEAAKKMLDAEKARAAAQAKKPNPDGSIPATPLTDPNAPKAAAPEDDAKKLERFETTVRGQADSLRFSFAEKKAELLEADGKKDKAVGVLDDFIKSVGEKSNARRSAESMKARLTLIGSAAPALAVERSYGDFKGLEPLKGKVIVLDCFAHWCGPCIRAFPEIREMYAALKDKGLEVVGVTTYYGYYKTERNLAKDDEFARMKDFIAEQNLTWPVMYGDRANFTAYGVSGIPHIVLIDKQGKVRKMQVGYSPDSFKKFRAEVEKILAE